MLMRMRMVVGMAVIVGVAVIMGMTFWINYFIIFRIWFDDVTIDEFFEDFFFQFGIFVMILEFQSITNRL